MLNVYLKEKNQTLNKCFTRHHLLYVPHKHTAVSKPRVLDMTSVPASAFAFGLALSHTGATMKCL